MYEDIELARSTSPAQENTSWLATIANTVAVEGADLFVVIPSIGEGRWGPCKGWESRPGGLFPVRGNEALVIFDDLTIPWIVAWWPYA